MTVRELIEAGATHPGMLEGALASIPGAAFLLGMAHPAGEGGRDPWRRAYTVLVYAATVPGMFSTALVAYALFITRENLLDVSIPVYFAPIVQMLVSLVVMSRNVDFDEVPGFDKIWGLMGLLGVTFTAVLFIQKTSILLIFHGSFTALALLAGVLFFVLRLSARALLGPGSRARP
ncbi:hypothetical protein EPO15_11115 [bacterium]|nr:MAG: hypothetical protein EPO15_11115 [bacterium]